MRIIKVAILLSTLILSGVATADFETGLVAHWSFDDCTAKDNTGNGHDGVVQGKPKCVSTTVNKGLKFNGVNDSITFKNMDNYFTTNDFSITYYFKEGANRRLESVISKRPICKNSPFIDIRSEGFALKHEIDDGISSWNIHSLKLNQGRIFVAMVRKGNSVFVYRNAKLDKKQLIANKVLDITNTAPFGISNSPCLGVDGTKKFSGYIDELRVYSRALSASDISDLFNSLVPVSGSVRSLPTYTVRCKNETTGQVVNIGTNTGNSYNCEANGLNVNVGENVSILINGDAQ